MKARHRLIAAALAGYAAASTAHDTWFERLPADADGVLLALGTGNRYPTFDGGFDARYLVHQGCRASRLETTMQPLRNDPATLVLQAMPGAATCWAQVAPFDVTLPPDKIELYLREINAGPELRATWAAMRERGLPWRERFTKHARIELGAPGAAPTPMAMDLLIERAGDGPLRAGDRIGVRVLRDGRPLAGLPVQLRGVSSGFGLWRRSDAEGRFEVPVPVAGRWLLRATDLRLSDSDPDRWESRFVTLAFEVGQNASSLTSNTLSTSQVAATAAITSEPPSITARR